MAGTGSSGYSGDGGLATAAVLKAPEDLRVDPVGNIYIADTGNHVICAVNVYNGKISTLAGIGGSAGYNGNLIPAVTAQLDEPAGVAVSGSKGGGRIYISDRKNNRVREMYPTTVKELY